MVDVLGRPLGYRADGRAVWPVRGGAEEGDGAGGGGEGAPAAGAEGAPGAAPAAGATDGSEEIELSPENFQRVIDELNRERAERQAAEAEYQRKLHATSQEAKKYRLQVRSLASNIADEATGKPGPKSAAAKKAAAAAGDDEGDARLAELAAKLEAAQRGSLLSGARAALAEAGVPKGAIAAAVRMVDLGALELGASGEVSGLEEQIEALKEAVPQLFAPAAAQTAAVGSGAAAGARILRAAPAVAGRGAAGRGGEAPKELTTAQKLANELLYGNREGAH